MASRSTSTASNSRRGGSRSRAAEGAVQTANQQSLQAQGATPAPTTAPVPQGPVAASGGEPNGGPTKTNDANLVMPHIQHSVLVSSMKAASAGFKAAINLEIAICCAVFIEAGDTSAKAKKELYTVYGDAGFDCKVGGEGKDYKTVNRRIGYAAQFYDSLEVDALKNIMGEARDEAAIQTLVSFIATKYNFRDMADVQEASGVVPASRQPRTPQGPQGGDNGGGDAAAPAQGQTVFASTGAANPVVTGAPSAADQGVSAAMQDAGAQRQAAEQQNRREFDDQTKWIRHTYEGAVVVVPVDFKVSNLHELGIKLVQAAAHMRGDKIDVSTLNAEFKELAVAAH